MGSRRSIGDRGEEIAIEYLKDKGYQIFERNYQIKGGEIDIVALQNGRYIFVEVRYRKDESYGHPLDTFSPSKRRSLDRTVRHYMMNHSIASEQARIDFIGIMPKNDGTNENHIWHIEGVEI